MTKVPWRILFPAYHYWGQQIFSIFHEIFQVTKFQEKLLSSITRGSTCERDKRRLLPGGSSSSEDLQ